MKEGIKCGICPHDCVIAEGQKGFCGARSNQGKQIVADNYGIITSIALDPIEKKPLRRFMPGHNVLSVGSYGCNLRCSFCQNYSISMATANKNYLTITPAQLVEKALELLSAGNIGLAYTYNEPLIGYEFVMDCARLAKESGLKNVVVTNGYINPKSLQELLPYIDALNIDLKGFTADFYRQLGGDLEAVKKSIALAAAAAHTEVTTLIIPGKNDDAKTMAAQAQWLAQVDCEIPLHITRFFPAYQMSYEKPTPVATLHNLAEIAGRYLKYVYVGNV